jgi:hypothetical protein
VYGRVCKRETRREGRAEGPDGNPDGCQENTQPKIIIKIKQREHKITCVREMKEGK